MYELIDTFNPTTVQFELANTQEAQNAYLQGAEQRNTNWFNRLFSNGIMQNHSIFVKACKTIEELQRLVAEENFKKEILSVCEEKILGKQMALAD